MWVPHTYIHNVLAAEWVPSVVHLLWLLFFFLQCLVCTHTRTHSHKEIQPFQCTVSLHRIGFTLNVEIFYFFFSCEYIYAHMQSATYSTHPSHPKSNNNNPSHHSTYTRRFCIHWRRKKKFKNNFTIIYTLVWR